MPVVADGENSLNRKQRSIDEVVFHGERDKREVALTFDADMTAGMESELRSGQVKSFYDSRIIDILERTQTKATLFLAVVVCGKPIEEPANLAGESYSGFGAPSRGSDVEKGNQAHLFARAYVQGSGSFCEILSAR